jgi:hypothetical protein
MGCTVQGWILVGLRFSVPVQASPETNPVPCTVGTSLLVFHRGRMPGCYASYPPLLKKKLKGANAGLFQHCDLRDQLCSYPWIVPSVVSRGAPHQAAWEASISEGGKLSERILLITRNELLLLGSFTCPKVGTWDRLFNFPSEGRHAEDFYIRKIQRLRPGLNSGTRGQHANH